jgi:thioesterase domain-containing protein
MFEAVARPFSTRDPRQAAVKRAVEAAAIALLARDQTVAEVVAALTDAVASIAPADVTPREGLAALRQSRREEMLDELARYERQGRGRDAAKMVARDFAADKRDAVEVASIARKLRRWRSEKNGQCPNATSELG